MASLADINNLINGLNDKALAWYQVSRTGVVVPGVATGVGTQYSYPQQSGLKPSGASTTPSGGTPTGQIVSLAAVGFAVLFLSLFVARRAKIL
jgi:hypothetical protein